MAPYLTTLNRVELYEWNRCLRIFNKLTKIVGVRGRYLSLFKASREQLASEFLRTFRATRMEADRAPSYLYHT
jgi:hypothetical protein